ATSIQAAIERGVRGVSSPNSYFVSLSAQQRPVRAPEGRVEGVGGRSPPHVNTSALESIRIDAGQFGAGDAKDPADRILLANKVTLPAVRASFARASAWAPVIPEAARLWAKSALKRRSLRLHRICGLGGERA